MMADHLARSVPGEAWPAWQAIIFWMVLLSGAVLGIPAHRAFDKAVDKAMKRWGYTAPPKPEEKL